MGKPSKLAKTAYHEAGHAVAAVSLRVSLKRASIEPQDDSLGRAEMRLPKSFKPDVDCGFKAQDFIQRKIRKIMVSFAGGAAEALFCGRKNHRGAASDYHSVVQLSSYVCGSKQEEEAFLDWLWLKTVHFLRNPARWSSVEAVAEELLVHRTLSGRRVRSIVQSNNEKQFAARLKQVGAMQPARQNSRHS